MELALILVLAVLTCILLQFLRRLLLPKVFDVAAFLAGTAEKSKQDARKVAVILNPVAGGQGKSEAIWIRVKTIFEAFGKLDLTLIRSSSAGDAKQWAAADALDFDTIVCIGGDGTLFEVVNGLLSRTDREVAAQISLAVIPAGTGNGLAKSLGIAPDEVERAAAIALRGKTQELDVVKATHGKATSFSFLFAAYGFLADVDFESDNPAKTPTSCTRNLM